LNFCVRFSHYNYCSGEPLTEWKPKYIFHPLPVPQLKKLTKLTIREPQGFQYTRIFLKELISMAPHLTSLYYKPTSLLSTFARTLKSMEAQVKGSLTSLGISDAHFIVKLNEKEEMTFPFLHLTTLQLNNIHGPNGIRWMETLIQAHHSTLVRLVLGYKNDEDEDYEDYSSLLTYPEYDLSTTLTFPPVMENLKSFEVNLFKFGVMSSVIDQEARFPILECVTCTGIRGIVDIPALRRFFRLFPTGFNHMLKQCFLSGRPIHTAEKERILFEVRRKFPNAECRFDS